MAPSIFTFTSATRGKINGHKVVEYRVREGKGGIVHSVAPLLLDRLEIIEVSDPDDGGRRHRVVAHYREPQGFYGTAIDFHVKDPTVLGLISDIREESGMSRLT